MLDDLKALVAVLDQRSVTHAARQLNLTQSAISRRIQHLEAMLGAPLLDRTNKPPTPTALAHRIYRHAIPLLQSAADLLAVAREDAAPSGIFRLGLTHVVADIALVGSVTQIRAAFPALDLQLQTDWSPGLQSQLHSGALDAASVILPTSAVLPEGMIGTIVANLEVVVVQSKAKPLASARGGIKALSQLEWILNPTGCGYRAALEQVMADSGKQLRLLVDTDDTDKQLSLVAAGLGLGLVPRTVLYQSRHLAELEIVAVKDFALRLDVWVIYPQVLGNLKRAAHLLTESIATAFARLPGKAASSPQRRSRAKLVISRN